MGQQFRLFINLDDTSAVQDDPDSEIASILTKLAGNVLDRTLDIVGEGTKLLDVNGNTVGYAEII
jgi:hypothetical protein